MKKLKLSKYILTAMVFLALSGGMGAWGAAYTWTGGAAGVWENAANWGGGIPGSGDTVTINTAAVISTSTPITVTALVINAGATLNLGNNLTVTGTGWTLTTTFLLESTGIAINLNGHNITAGVLQFGSTTQCSVAITGGGTITTTNADTSNTTNNFITMTNGANLTVSNIFYCDSTNSSHTTFSGDSTGTVSVATMWTSPILIFDGVSVSDGTNSYSMDVAGTIASNNTITVTLNGTFPPTAFTYSADVITPTAGETYSISGGATPASFTADVASGTIATASSGYSFTITLPTVAVTHGVIITIFAPDTPNPVSLGAITFIQNGTDTVWIGGSGGNAWDVTANWTNGVPTGNNAIIPQLANLLNYPVVTPAGASAGTLTIDSGATLTLGTFGLTVAGALTNNGTISLEGNLGQISAGSIINGPSSTIVYTGAAADPLAWGTSYRNLTVNPGAILSLGGTNVTVAGTLDNNGTIVVDGAGTINKSDSSGGIFEYSAAAATSIPTLNGYNSLDITNGARVQTNNFTANTLTIDAPASLTVGTFTITVNTALTNNNLIVIDDSGTISRSDPSHGTFRFSGGGTIPNNTGYFNLEVTAGTATTGTAVTVANGLSVTGGTLSVPSLATLTLNGTSNTVTGGTLDIASGGTVAAGTHPVSINTAGALTTAGTLNCGDFTCTTSVTNSGVNSITASGNVSITGTYGGAQAAASTVSMTGTGNLEATPQIGILSVSGGATIVNHALSVAGTLSVGGTLSDNTNNLGIAVTGTSTINGTLNAGTGTNTFAAIGGTGIFNAGSGTVTVSGNLSVTTFNHQNGTMQLTGGLAQPARTFNNLNIDGTVQSTGAWTILGDIQILSGSWTSGAVANSIAGNWTNAVGAPGFGGAGSTVIFTGTGAHAIDGDTNFINLTDNTPGSTLTFTAGGTFGLSGALTLAGGSGANLITVQSSILGTAWNLNNTSSSPVSSVRVADSHAANTITATDSICLNSNNTNWTFGDITWLGLTSDANAPSNWSTGVTPGQYDAVTILSGVTQPIQTADLPLKQLTIADPAASWSNGGHDLTLGTYDPANSGTFIYTGTGTIGGIPASFPGTFEYSGGTPTMHTGINNYENLVISGGTITARPVTVTGTTAITGGILSVGAITLNLGTSTTIDGTLDTSGTINCAALTCNAGGTINNTGVNAINASGAVTISGNFTGTATNSTITMTGAGTSITATPVIGNLTLSSSGSISAGGTVSLAGTLDVTTNTFNVGANALNVGGDILCGSGHLSCGAGSVITLDGSGPQNANFTGSTIRGLSLNNAAGATLNNSAAFAWNGNCTVTSGSLVLANVSQTIGGSVTGPGTLDATALSGTLTIAGPSWNVGTFTAGSSTVEFTSNTTISSANTFHNLTKSTGGTVAVNANTTVSAALSIPGGILSHGNVTLAAGSLSVTGGTYDGTGNGTLTLLGPINATSGTLNLGSKLVTGVTTFTATGATTIANLNAADISTSSDTIFTASALGTAGGTSIVRMSGGNLSIGTYGLNNLAVAGPVTVILNGPTPDVNALTVTAGPFAVNGNNFQAATATISAPVTVAAGGAFSTTSTMTVNTGGSVTASMTGTVTSGSTLTVNGSGSISVASGSLSVSSGGLSVTNATGSISSAGTISITGTTSNAGTIQSTAGTQNYSLGVTNTGTITGAGLMTFSGALTSSGAFTVGAGNATVAGIADFSGGTLTLIGTLSLANNLMFDGTTTVAATDTDIIIFTGAGNQQLTSGGQSLPSIQVNKSGGSVQLQDNTAQMASATLTFSNTAITDFDLNTRQFTPGADVLVNAFTILTVGSGTWEGTGHALNCSAGGHMIAAAGGSINASSITHAGAGASTWNTGGLSIGSLTVSGGSITQSLSTVLPQSIGSITVSGGSLTLGAGPLTLAGSISVASGTLNLGSKVITGVTTFSATGATTIANLNAADITTSSNVTFTATGGGTAGGSSIIRMSGGDLAVGLIGINNLTITGVVSVIQAVAATDANALTVTSGSLAVGTYNFQASAATVNAPVTVAALGIFSTTNTMAVGTGGSVTASGSGTVTSGNTLSLAGNGYITMDTGTLTVSAGGLSLTGTGTISSAGTGLNAIEIATAGNLSWTAGATSGISITGTGNLHVSGNLIQAGPLNGQISLASGNVNIDGMTDLYRTGVPQITTSGAVTCTGSATLYTNASITASTTTFYGTIDGNTHSLTLSNNAVFGDGTTDIVTGITLLSVTGTTSIYTNAITTSAGQSYTGPVTLYNTSSLTDIGSSAIAFNSTVNAATAGGQSLTVDTSGNITFTGAVGASGANRIATLTAGSTLNPTLTTFSDTVYAINFAFTGTALTLNNAMSNTGTSTVTNSGTFTKGTTGTIVSNSGFTQNGTGANNIGSNITTRNTLLSFQSAITLTADAIFSTQQIAGAGNVTLSTVNGGHVFQITAGTGTVNAGAIGATTALTSLTINGSAITLSDIGTATLSGVSTTVSVTGSGAITLNGSNYRSGNTQTFTATTAGVRYLATANGTWTAGGAGIALIGGTDLYLDHGGHILTIGCDFSCRDLIFYNGTLSLGTATLTARNLAAFGGTYSADDHEWDAGGDNIAITTDDTRFAYYFNTPPQYAPAGSVYNAGQHIFTTLTPNAQFTFSGSAITVTGNFYDNGVTSAGTCALTIPDNAASNPIFNAGDSASASQWGTPYAVAFNIIGTDITVAGGYLAGGAAHGIGTPGAGNWQTITPIIYSVETVYDDVVLITFNIPIENSHGEINAVLALGAAPGDDIRNGSVWYNFLGTHYKFAGAYSNPECTTPLANIDTDSFYIQTNGGRWNTDATGSAPGDADSTDRGRGATAAAHQTTVPNLSFLEGLFYAANGKTMCANYGVNTALPYTATTDGCHPVLVEVHTGQEAHTTDDLDILTPQSPYDAHNFIEFRWSEPVTLTVGVDSYPDTIVNEPTTISIGNITQVGSSLNIAGLGLIQNGALVSDSHAWGAAAAAGVATHAVYRNFSLTGAPSAGQPQPHRLRVSIAGRAELGSSHGEAYAWYWPGFISSATTPTGPVAASPTGLSIVDQAANTLEEIVPIPAYGRADVVVSSAPVGLYGPWDVTGPAPAALKLAATPWTDPPTIYEAVPDATGGMINRIEMHFFDNKPTYSASDDWAWYSRRGWYVEGAVPTILTQPSAEAPESFGGSRPWDDGTGNYRTTSGGIRECSLNSAENSFRAFYNGNTVVSSPDSFSTNVSTSLLAPITNQNVAGDPYLRLFWGTPTTWPIANSSVTVSYNTDGATEGYVTDLAGNLLSSFSHIQCIDRTAPKITFTLAGANRTDLYVLFSKDLVLPANYSDGISVNLGGTVVTPTAATTVNGNDRALLFTLPASVRADNLVNPASLISIVSTGSYVDPDTTLTVYTSRFIDALGNYAVAGETHRLTDIGIGLVEVLYGSDGVNEPGLLGNQTGALRSEGFDGTGRLLDKDITIATWLNLPSAPGSLALYFDVNPPAASMPVTFNAATGDSLALWLPSVLSGFNNSGNQDARTLSPTLIVDAARLFRNFLIPESDTEVVPGAKVDMLMQYQGLYCARLSDPSDITSLAPWSFTVAETRHQRGGVTILNNVIDSNKREKTIVQVDVPKAGNIVIQVFTLDGNIVKVLERGRKGSGLYSYYWDGTNGAGNAVARGIYFIRVVGPGMDEIRKVMVVKD